MAQPLVKPSLALTVWRGGGATCSVAAAGGGGGTWAGRGAASSLGRSSSSHGLDSTSPMAQCSPGYWLRRSIDRPGALQGKPGSRWFETQSCLRQAVQHNARLRLGALLSTWHSPQGRCKLHLAAAAAGHAAAPASPPRRTDATSWLVQVDRDTPAVGRGDVERRRLSPSSTVLALAHSVNMHPAY